MSGCTYCATDDVTYDGICSGCVVRRLARAPLAIRQKVVANHLENHDAEAAQELTAKIAVVYERLKANNNL